jgi:hypothetical protein
LVTDESRLCDISLDDFLCGASSDGLGNLDFSSMFFLQSIKNFIGVDALSIFEQLELLGSLSPIRIATSGNFPSLPIEFNQSVLSVWSASSETEKKYFATTIKRRAGLYCSFRAKKISD